MMQLLDQLHTCNGGHLQVSPDGKSLAYLAPSEDKDVLNVWVRPVDSDNARMVTKDELRGIRYSTVASASYFQLCLRFVAQGDIHCILANSSCSHILTPRLRSQALV